MLVDSDGYTHALLVTSYGQVKRVEWALLAGAHPGGLTCFRVPDGDAIIQVVPHNEGDQIVCSTIFGQALRIEAGKIRAVASGAAGGVAGMTLHGDDEIIWATRADGDDLVVIHETGFAKRVPLAEYPVKVETLILTESIRSGVELSSGTPSQLTRGESATTSGAVMSFATTMTGAAGGTSRNRTRSSP